MLDLPAGSETASDGDLAAHQARVIHEQIIRLERFKTEDLAEVDAIDHDASALGRETKPDPAVCLIRRYKAAAQREMDKAKGELERLQARAAEEARKAAEIAREARLIPPRIPEAMRITRPRPDAAAVPAEMAAAPAATETSTPVSSPQTSTPSPVDVSVARSSSDPDFEAMVCKAFAAEQRFQRGDRRKQDRAQRAAHRDLPR